MGKSKTRNGYDIVSDTDVLKVSLKHGLIPLEEYVNSITKMLLVDKYGYKYSSSYTNLKSKKPILFSPLNPYTLDNIKQYIKNNKIEVELLSTEYIDSYSDLKFKCGCGNIFYTCLQKFLHRGKCQCNDCGAKIRIKKKSLDSNFVINHIKEMGYEVISEYTKTESFITLMDKDGYKYYTSYHNLKLNKPQKFYIDNPYTIENIQNYIKLNKLTCKVISDKWVGNAEPMEFECECGEHFYTPWTSFTLQNKNFCDTCSRKKSILERKVEIYLQEKNINFKSEYSFKDLKYQQPLRFDFAVFDDNDNLLYLIEAQGLQHYQPVKFGDMPRKESERRFKEQVEKDNLKRKYCKENNIPLLELNYKLFKHNSKKYINELNLFDLAHRI